MQKWSGLAALALVPQIRQSSFHQIIIDVVTNGSNRYSAFDSVDLTFTRSYRSALLIATPTPILTPTYRFVLCN